MINVVDTLLHRLTTRITQRLKTQQTALRLIQWQDHEANLDSGFSKLACQAGEQVWSDIKDQYPRIKDVEFTAPDVQVTFYFQSRHLSTPTDTPSRLTSGTPHQLNIPLKSNKKITPIRKPIHRKIELKSSKSKIMPGSTVLKLNVNQPLIYCLRPTDPTNDSFQLRCAHYYQAMGESDYDRFQDRSPRPSLNFDRMVDDYDFSDYQPKEKDDWADHYTDCALRRIDGHLPKKCKDSWQDGFIRKMKDRIISQFVDQTTIEEFIQMKHTQRVEK